MEKNNAQLAEELAEIAIEKRANNALQQLWERLMSLPPAQRNAIIGGLLGGAGTGAVSAATGGNAILDAILGAGLGASAGYGGTRAYRHITGEDQIPSKGMAQNWQEVEKALPVGQAENAARAAVTGGAVAGAGSLGGLYVDHVNRQLEGFRGARTKAPMLEQLRGKFHADRNSSTARSLLEGLAAERMGQTAEQGLESINPLRRISALRKIKKTVPQQVFNEARRMMTVRPEHAAPVMEVLGKGPTGAARSIGAKAGGRVFTNAAEVASKIKFKPSWGKWGFLPGALLGGYMLLKGGDK